MQAVEGEKSLDRSDYSPLEIDDRARSFGEKWKNHWEEGWYCCGFCSVRLFSHKDKFTPNKPSRLATFTKPIQQTSITQSEDCSYGYPRDIISCAKCGLYLGTALRDTDGKLYYAVLSICITFESRANAADPPQADETPMKKDTKQKVPAGPAPTESASSSLVKYVHYLWFAMPVVLALVDKYNSKTP
jgi:peptide methionine sulfoxide reductase MsrB